MENTSDGNLLANTMHRSLPAADVAAAAKSMRETKWKNPDMSNVQSLFYPPQEKALKNVFVKGFDQIQQYLRRDLYSQRAGRILRWDGVYGPAKKTINNPELEEDINCLLFLQGEKGNYLGGYYVEEETEENVKRAAYIYYNRASTILGDGDGYDNPTKINNWNCTQLERIIFEFGGKQRGNRDAKRGELRKLLEKYRKKAPTNNST
mmetsp:Transcript_33514/g.98764  ORF Transcript_33514/g.98764 Transcript_33514/m.98764 type:complete len:207 (-) Transcript_33514:53-673(-)